ncbi:hypothetical protein [Streptomyces sp. 35G-GA-8]|uniref:hypothetical protein n=1 Tax=Streptomyces sp. 35G-GA-8 TaxID=2939434 RepID=UPI00201EF023|nr:hypothetical protein [Streptomyces sp. 35G-GA-8]MCL7379404.1 hypothetical protein [Streptomyces sp. 35G-GA-8]
MATRTPTPTRHRTLRPHLPWRDDTRHEDTRHDEARHEGGRHEGAAYEGPKYGGERPPGARDTRPQDSGRHEHRVSPRLVGNSLLLGVAYGAYASFIARGGGPATFGQLALALISGALAALLVFGLVRVQHRLMREVRAAAWGVLVGGGMGFLYSLTNHSVLLCSGIGLAFGAATVIVVFYGLYTREPRESPEPRESREQP